MYLCDSSWLAADWLRSYRPSVLVRQNPQQEPEAPAHLQKAAEWASGSLAEVQRPRRRNEVEQVAAHLGAAVAAAAEDAGGAAAGGVADAVDVAELAAGVAGDAAAEDAAGGGQREDARPVEKVPGACAGAE